MKKQHSVAVVVLNWNGKNDTLSCLDSLSKQELNHTVVVVDNASTDDSVNEITKEYPGAILINNLKNLGFAGGVNTGIKYALANGYEHVALLNNDATTNKKWLKELVNTMNDYPEVGIVTGKLLKTDGKTIDSTGDFYTTWGLPYPRARDETDAGKYDKPEYVFAGSGGASLYRIDMFKQIGLFDEDFFAYYEDVDLSFRAQLSGWKVRYEPIAVAYHATGSTSGKIKGFTTYQTIKNWPWLLWKNVPAGLLPKILPRFTLAYISVIFSSLLKGKFLPVIKGVFVSFLLLPKKLAQRVKIQKHKKVTNEYINSILVHDLPPNAAKLRKIRSFFVKST